MGAPLPSPSPSPDSRFPLNDAQPQKDATSTKVKRPKGSRRELRRVFWYLLALAPCLAAIISNVPGLLALAIVILLISAIPDIWGARSFKRFFITLKLNRTRAFQGESVMFTVTLDNRTWLPLPWIETRSMVPNALMVRDGVVERTDRSEQYTLVDGGAFWGKQSITRQYTLFCGTRGIYRMGPILLRASDPLGWRTLASRFKITLPVVIYPLIAPLDDASIQAIQPFGAERTPIRLFEDPLRVVGAREYQHGDDPRRIHWKATARTGTLYSKTLDPGGQQRITLLLDVASFMQPGPAYAPPLLEYAITVVASLAHWALDQGYATGLLANAPILTPSEEEAVSVFPPVATTYNAADVRIGKEAMAPAPGMDASLWLAPSSRANQREELLAALTRLRPQVGEPVERIVDAYRVEMGMGTTLLLVTATAGLRPETSVYLSGLRRRGMQAQIILVGPRQASAMAPTYDLPTHRIGGMEVWHELLTSAFNGSQSGDTPRLHLD